MNNIPEPVNNHAPKSQTMIKFESVCLSLQGKEILTNFDLTILKNEKVLIQGKSGIGKTTLFKLLLGFGTIDKGKVIFNGCKISKAHITGIREQIFYLSQDIDLRDGIINNLINEILKANSISYKNDKLNELLTFLDLNIGILEQNVKDLSGGERQRVGLLICFLLDRPVWLFDEPTSALDDVMKKKIVDFILDQEKTIIIISHDSVWKKNRNIKIERWE
ncbi:MAG: ATP-binding cassette domain-containing protein [Deltaproteobacteria bacterium]|jgi:putative ABC transport system ATP-binding protein|nr:ATP-binding cassette domain-containing protein [Deltaproteobacteria bacterium]